MRKINVVQIGTWKYTHAEHIMMSMRSMPQHFNIVGICEPDGEQKQRALNIEAYKGLKWLELDEALNDTSLDAVIIETKELEQAKYALMFAEKGFNLHLEKPGAVNYGEFEQIVRYIKQNNAQLQLGYMYRYNPAVMRAVENIKAGKIGDLICMEAHMSQRYGRNMLDFLGELPGGMMYYLGCHLIDLLYLIMGSPKGIVSMNRASGLEGASSIDSGLALYEYDKGVSILKTVATEIDGNMRRYIAISGTKGTIEIKPIENPLIIPRVTNANTVSIVTKYYPETVSGVLRTEEMTLAPYGRYDEMMLDFAKIVTGDKQNPYTLEHELAVFDLITKSL